MRIVEIDVKEPFPSDIKLPARCIIVTDYHDSIEGILTQNTEKDNLLTVCYNGEMGRDDFEALDFINKEFGTDFKATWAIDKGGMYGDVYMLKIIHEGSGLMKYI